MHTHLATFHDTIQRLTLTSALGREFILTEQLMTWLNSSCLEEPRDHSILEGLFNDTLASHKLTEIHIPPWERESVLLFCLLLHLGLGQHLSEFRDIFDDDLPLPVDAIHRMSNWLETEKILDGFYDIQWRYFPARFHLDSFHAWPAEIILPICAKSLIGNGRTASVYEVAIPEEFLGPELRATVVNPRFEDPRVGPGWYYRLAMKTFNGWNSELGRREMAVSRNLKHSQNFITPLVAFTTVQGDNNIESAGNVTDSRKGCNFLFELAEMDLNGYLASTDPPVTCLEIGKFWSNLNHIVDGIRELHQPRHESASTSSPGIIVGYHHDIKPSNILVSRGRFQLSDFGFASFIPADGSLIPASPATGTLSYGPPKPSVYTNTGVTVEGLLKFDIWSLGCVLSEAATWIVLGTPGVEQFSRLRSEALNELCTAQERQKVESQAIHHENIPRRGDYFHDGRNVLKVVTSWHRHLRSSLRRSDTITSKILDLVDKDLLPPPFPGGLIGSEHAVEMSVSNSSSAPSCTDCTVATNTCTGSTKLEIIPPRSAQRSRGRNLGIGPTEDLNLRNNQFERVHPTSQRAIQLLRRGFIEWTLRLLWLFASELISDHSRVPDCPGLPADTTGCGDVIFEKNGQAPRIDKYASPEKSQVSCSLPLKNMPSPDAFWYSLG
ncbi:hypothetical protein DL98DRAFT_627424 [Cadophora sp. DSE1049]|nr:hypothetical protein DL98DRAFT_627424 [Cadophora sp. DSE1049]